MTVLLAQCSCAVLTFIRTWHQWSKSKAKKGVSLPEMDDDTNPSRWTMTYSRSKLEDLPPLGLSSMIKLVLETLAWEQSHWFKTRIHFSPVFALLQKPFADSSGRAGTKQIHMVFPPNAPPASDYCQLRELSAPAVVGETFVFQCSGSFQGHPSMEKTGQDPAATPVQLHREPRPVTRLH